MHSTVSHATRESFCQEQIGGVYDDASATCTVERRSDGLQPSCIRANASYTYHDEFGACYDFQRLEDSVYRHRYRLTEQCYTQVESFHSTVVKDICADTSSWYGAAGSFVEHKFAQVAVPTTPDARDCRNHHSESRCEAGLCEWSDKKTYILCTDESTNDCIASCTAMGGDFDVGGEVCVVPECRPAQMAVMPCD